MFDPNMLDELLKKGTGRKARNPNLGLGSFELTLVKFRKLSKKSSQMLMIGGIPTAQEVEQITAYILDARVDKSTSAKNPPGSMVSVYFNMSGTKDWQKESDSKDAFELVQAVYRAFGIELVGAKTEAEAAQAKQYINEFFGNENLCRGVRLKCDTRLPKSTDKDGNPKKKAPDENGYLFKNWTPVKMTAEELAASRATLPQEAPQAAA